MGGTSGHQLGSSPGRGAMKGTSFSTAEVNMQILEVFRQLGTSSSAGQNNMQISSWASRSARVPLTSWRMHGSGEHPAGASPTGKPGGFL